MREIASADDTEDNARNRMQRSAVTVTDLTVKTHLVITAACIFA